MLLIIRKPFEKRPQAKFTLIFPADQALLPPESISKPILSMIT
jgi:hypothetical protein